MPIKINIKWDFVSPSLGRASGIVKVVESHVSKDTRVLVECKCFIERGCSGFKSMEGTGIPTKTFDLFEDAIRTVMRNYHDGLLLRNEMHHWLPETLQGDGTFEEWKLRQKHIRKQLHLKFE